MMDTATAYLSGNLWLMWAGTIKAVAHIQCHKNPLGTQNGIYSVCGLKSSVLPILPQISCHILPFHGLVYDHILGYNICCSTSHPGLSPYSFRCWIPIKELSFLHLLDTPFSFSLQISAQVSTFVLWLLIKTLKPEYSLRCEKLLYSSLSC